VSRLLHKYTVPQLYRAITFFADEQNLVELGIDSFLARNTRLLCAYAGREVFELEESEEAASPAPPLR
jgi:hypothetical protein